MKTKRPYFAPLAAVAIAGALALCLAAGSGADLAGLPFKSANGEVARSLADRFADVHHVKDFGAKGDGVTNDTAAIQRAIDVAVSESGGVVYLPRGVYIVQGLSLKQGVYFVGDGTTQTTLKLPASPTSAMFIAPTTAVYTSGGFSRMGFDGRDKSRHCIDFSAASELLDYMIADDLFANFDTAIKGCGATNSTNAFDHYITVRDSRIVNCNTGCHVAEHMLVGNVEFNTCAVGITGRMLDCHVVGGRFIFCTDAAKPFSGQYFTNSKFVGTLFYKAPLTVTDGCVVSGCDFTGDGTAGMWGVKLLGSRDAITGNRFGYTTSATGFGAGAIDITVAGDIVNDDMVITGNVFANGAGPAITQGDANRTRLATITGNTFYCSGQRAIYYPASTAFYNSIIADNVFHQAGSLGSSNLVQINTTFDVGFAFRGNTVFKEGTWSGAVIGGEANYATVTNNRLSGTTSLFASGMTLTGTHRKLNMTDTGPLDSAVVLTDAATIATDAGQSDFFRVTLGGNRTLGNPSNPTDGQRATWELIQDGTGSRTITLAGKFSFGTDVTGATLTTAAGKHDFLSAAYNATADKWYVTGFTRGY